MKHLLISIAALLCLTVNFANAADAVADDTFQQQVANFLDEWHDDAFHARARYFDKMAPEGVYIGTDKSERWTREEFRLWAKPYFDSGKTWEFHAYKRNIAFTPDKHFIWFDEQLNTQMGVCQASGVIENTPHGLQIEHYQLSLAVPNDLVEHLQGEIKEYDAAHPGK